MSRPQLEVADIIRSASTDFVERNRHWLRWIHLKVLRAIARCRTAALAGHIDECTCCGHRAPISYNRCRNRHCPKCQTGARERWIVVNCCPRPTSMSSSPCRRNWLRWLSRTGNSSTVCCFAPAQKLYSKWLVIPPISEPRSASSACCTPATRNSNCILMSIVSFPQVDSPAITPAGFDPTRASSFPSPYCGACSVASSSLL